MFFDNVMVHKNLNRKKQLKIHDVSTASQRSRLLDILLILYSK